ncbi:MAG TPA: NADP-dependent oxidoreductase [Caulobacteraceae bacterium]|jgi:NADPH:quinone reductase-like Zn-dependent oxidoreductase|nr:NADP-dependent oxidoreductase [Caulobacteraceae bacterium]
MTTAHAIRIHSFGGPEVLQEDEVEIRAPGDGEMLVRVMAAGVNPVDHKIRQGGFPAVKEDKLPFVLGRDVAGEVVELGTGVGLFAKRDRIYAMPALDRGGYAELAIVREDEAAFAPAILGMVQAGGTPLAALTAWQGLFQHGGLIAGQKVLIHGGAGGVGHFAVQFARAKGALVYVTAAAEDLDFVRGLGADVAIDYKAQRFEDEAKDMDLVYDLIGGETQNRSFQVLRRGGALVTTLAEPSQEKAAERGVKAMRYTAHESGHQLEVIGELIGLEKVKVHVARTFPLAQAAQAQKAQEAGHTRGKIVLTVAA